MISKIIAEYLKTETRIIVPELGAFIRRKDSNEIIFMELLKTNDGVLVGLVKNLMGLSEDAAIAEVEKYILQVKSGLSAKKKFIVDAVGVLFINPSGAIEFTYNPFARTIPDSETQRNAAHTFSPATSQPTVTEASMFAPAEQAPSAQKADAAADVAEKHEPKAGAEEDETANGSGMGFLRKAQRNAQNTEIHIHPHHKRKKLDPITILAIVAVILAIVSLIWGVTPNKIKIDVADPTEQSVQAEPAEPAEQSALDIDTRNTQNK